MARASRALYDVAQAGGNVDRLDKLRTAYWNERSNADALYRELADHFAPTRVRFTQSDRNQPNTARPTRLIDSTSLFAVETAMAGMHSGMTSKARPWFQLTTPDPSLAKHKPVQAWLYQVTDIMRSVLNDSTVYKALPTVYGDMSVFGCGAMGTFDDEEDFVRVETYPLGSYAFAVDKKGLPSLFIYDYTLSVLQVVEEFALSEDGRTLEWGNLSRTVRNLFEQSNYTAPVQLCWVVERNYGFDPEKIGQAFMPWRSCYYERGSDTKKLLRESGYETFPVMTPRWGATGQDAYARGCPGMTALGDARQLQGMERKKGKAIEKMVDPPMTAEAELKGTKVSVLPNDITYVKDTRDGFKPAYQVNLAIDHLVLDEDRVRQRIKTAFYEPLFLMIANTDERLGSRQMTAREVDERSQEKMLTLGPLLERSNSELHDPLVTRVYRILERRNKLPPLPRELQGVPLKVEYTSILAAAQKLAGVAMIDRFVASVFPIVQADPATRHKLNANAIIDAYQEGCGVNPDFVRSNEEADRIAGEEQEQQRALAEAQRAQLVARAGREASQTPMGDGQTLLDRAAAVAQSQTVQ